MSGVLEILGDLPLWLKTGWMVFAAWSLAQVAWYQRARMAVAVPAKPARKRARNSSARRPAVRGTPRASRSPERDAGSPELLASLGLLTTSGASDYGVPMSPADQSGPTVIA